jgi:hypothetical protein
MPILIRNSIDTDPDPVPDRYQNDADPNADPTQSFPHDGKLEEEKFLVCAATAVYNVFPFLISCLGVII